MNAHHYIVSCLQDSVGNVAFFFVGIFLRTVHRKVYCSTNNLAEPSFVVQCIGLGTPACRLVEIRFGEDIRT